MNLSKSKYCSGIQCMKMLWLEKNKPEVAEEVSNQATLDNGTEVGIIAKNLFGPYVDIDYQEDLQKMVEQTKKEIEEPKDKVITEASFLYENLFCSVDLLRKIKNHYQIYEVKSSTEVKDIYIEDASYQYYVLTSLGLKVDKVCIVHLNSQYKRKGDLELDKLFCTKDITSIAKKSIPQIKKNIKEINQFMEQITEPQTPIGIQCSKPYDCLFFSYCTRHLEKPNVFDIRGMRFSSKMKYYHQGIITFEDLMKIELNSKYKDQVEFTLKKKEDKIDIKKIKEFLNTLSYPLYFLDFETYQQAIPEYDDISPYEQIPFQYSLHLLKEDGNLSHREFLAEPNIDPRRQLAEQLVKDIPKNVCSIAYNMSFERNIIKQLADLYPDLREHLLNIRENMKDLMIPFYHHDYYTENMQGSYSIKYVLPALFPNEDSLNYHNLEDVHNGSEAMNAYANMGKLTKEEQTRLRKNLLKYCELDTYAMVKIFDKLQKVVKKGRQN